MAPRLNGAVVMTFIVSLLGSLMVSIIMGLLQWLASMVNRVASRKIGDGVLERWFWNVVTFGLFFWINVSLYPRHSLEFKAAVSASASMLELIYYKQLIAFWESDGIPKYTWTASGSLILERPSLILALRRRFRPIKTHVSHTGTRILITHPSSAMRIAGFAIHLLLVTMPLPLTLAVAIGIHRYPWLFCVKATAAGWAAEITVLTLIITISAVAIGSVILCVEWVKDHLNNRAMRILGWSALLALLVGSFNFAHRPPPEPPTMVDRLSSTLRRHAWGWDELVTFLTPAFEAASPRAPASVDQARRAADVMTVCDPNRMCCLRHAAPALHCPAND